MNATKILFSLMLIQPCYVVGTHVMNAKCFAKDIDKSRFRNTIHAYNSIIRQYGWRGLYRGGVPTFLLFFSAYITSGIEDD